jgi:hypothetical protein
MNEQQLAAVKQALEALESERDKYLEWGDEDGAPEDVYEAITALQSIISQDALDKMAENARQVGLDYEPAVQEPVFCEYCGGNDDADFGLPTDHCTDCARPQPVPVKTYHDGKPWPVAPKPWVGLTDAEIDKTHETQIWDARRSYARAIEAKLKEKNT